VMPVAFPVRFGFLNLGTQQDIVRLVIISIGTTVAIITILFWSASAALPTARRRYQSITCAFFVIAAGTATMILAARFHNIYISRTVNGNVVATDFYAALTASELKLTFYTQPEEPLTFKGMSTHDSILVANLEVEMKSDKQFVLTNFHVPQHIILRYELAHPAGLQVTREP